MKSLFSLIFILTIFCITNAAVFFQFRSVQCSASGKTVNITFCYPKRYGKRFTFNIELTFLRPMEHSKFNYGLYRENSMKTFDSILKLENINLCEALRMTEHIGLIKVLSEELKRLKLENLVNACTQPGTCRALNVSLSENPIVQVLPSATYKTIAYFTDDVDENILNMTFLARLIRK